MKPSWFIPIALLIPLRLSAIDAAVGARVATITINPREITVLHLRPEFESTIRMPEEVTSVILGSPGEFKAEHNEGEPEYVYVKPITKLAAQSNLLIATKSGQHVTLELVSDGASAPNQSQPVDFLIEYRSARSFLISADSGVPIMPAEAGKVAAHDTRVRDAGSGSSPLSNLDEEFRQQQKVNAPKWTKWEEKQIETSICDVRQWSNETVIAYSILNISEQPVEIVPPQIQMTGRKATKKKKKEGKGRLRMTQPNLTKQVQELEDYLGVMLFVRSNKGVVLKEPCKTFIEESKLSLLHLDRAIHRTRAVAQGVDSILNFGSSPYMDPYLVTLMLSVKLPRYPKLSVRASSAFSEELCHQVLTSQLDIALVASGLPDSRLNFLHIASHPFYAVFQSQDGLAKSAQVSLHDYHDRVWILFGRQVHPTLYDQVRERANELGVRPREIHHVTSAEQATYLIHHHGAVAFLTQIGAWRIARDGLTMRPLADDQLVLKTALVTRADDRSRLTSEFLRAAVRQLQVKSGAQRERLSLAG